MYMRIKLPIISSREFITYFTFENRIIDGKDTMITAMISVDYPGKTVYPGAIRGEFMRVAMITQEEDGIRIKQIMHFDIKGWFPS